MKLKPYPEYKDSGVEWLGMVPDGWIVKPLFSVARERNESNRGMKEINLLSLSYGTIANKDIDSNEGLLPDSFETYQIIHEGDIVFRLTDLQNDKRSLRTAIVEEKGIITSAYVAVCPQGIDSKFLNYLLRSYDTQKVFYSMGGGLRQSMKFSDIKRLPILIPEHKQQERIIFYIDRETAKLETLIAKQEKLIELLQEKRQGIISHAVTKGLDANVKMKKSGSEFLGDVPESWNVFKVRRCLIEHRQGYYPTDPYTEYGVKLLRITDLRKYAGVEFSESPYVELKEDISPFLLMRNDFVFARTGGAGLFGVIGDVDIPVIYASYLIRFRFTLGIETDFLKYFFLSSKFQDALKQNIHGGVNQNVHAEDIKNQYIALPEKLDQIEIVNFLNKQTSKLDGLISKAEQSICLAKEHRTALISAAVTGKIDLREYEQ